MLVEHALATDLAAIRDLLEAAGLPISDLESARQEFVVLRDADKIVAAGALERFGSAALLRSVIVAESARGRGVGHRVVQELECMALRYRIEQLVLLTQTAAKFFRNEGYRTIERSDAPQAIQGSTIPVAVSRPCDLHGENPRSAGLDRYQASTVKCCFVP